MMNKEELKSGILNALHGIDPKTATPQQLHQALGETIMEAIAPDWNKSMDAHERSRRACYFSMEFLVGRAVYNNLLVLDVMKEAEAAFAELGVSLADLEVIEDAALGNGGLGRLAACFLDSAATLDLPLDGYGIRYKYGLFKQYFEDGFQKEVPDDWMRYGDAWSVRRDEDAVLVEFEGQTVRAVPYDMPVIGCKTRHIGNLRLWQAEPVHTFDFDLFNQQKYLEAAAETVYAEDISRVLYPNDDTWEGKKLRLKQQYFFVSASVQRAVARYKKYHPDIHKLSEKVTIQMNDTHPTVAVAELMRILLDEEGLTWDEAWAITTKTCAYTNHTIMAEALEKWPIEIFSRLLPRIYQIVQEIDRRFVIQVRETYPGNEEKVAKMQILRDGQVKMAHLAIVAGYSVNGVARLHTEILKKQELRDFYEMMPEKFNNKTNGITQRRFLLHGNPLLASWVTDKIGDDWITNLDHLKHLKVYVDDEKCQQEFMNIKYQNKVRLAKYIKEHNGIDVDPRSIFDCQVKRLHEYKRQLMNILHVMYLYNEIKAHPDMDIVPRTFIFGAKAAAGYYTAKLTIKLINAVADKINNDPSINGKIKVVFIEDYRVSNAELIFAAADVSEQISTASKEASGTGNMKFMLNGALTLGTMDGANVEIVEEVGKENAFIFGLSADQVMEYEKNGNYNPRDVYNNNQDVRQVLTQLVNGFYSPENPELFRALYDALLEKDTYFTLLDFDSYKEAHNRIDAAYRDEEHWARTAMLQTASAGKFSSDRTIEEYAKEMWHLEKVTL